MSVSGPAVRLSVELRREQDRVVAHVRADGSGQDYGAVALGELTLLLEAVVADAEAVADTDADADAV